MPRDVSWHLVSYVHARTGGHACAQAALLAYSQACTLAAGHVRLKAVLHFCRWPCASGGCVRAQTAVPPQAAHTQVVIRLCRQLWPLAGCRAHARQGLSNISTSYLTDGKACLGISDDVLDQLTCATIFDCLTKKNLSVLQKMRKKTEKYLFFFLMKIIANIAI